MTRRPPVTPSSGNVFADLGFEKPEEELLNSELALKIAEIIASKNLTQTAAAAIMGVDQPKVSAIVHGRLDGFSTERLLNFLASLGQHVEIIIQPASTGRITVTRRPTRARSADARRPPARVRG
jgi:predicted XRE-type DNA-binding protein